MPDAGSAQDRRQLVRDAVAHASEPVTVEQVATTTGLHANTVRGHLDVLLATGEIAREAADSHGRGRPRWLYRATGPAASPYQFLADALTVQLVRTHDPLLADAAAERWAHALPDLPVAATPDEAVDEATDALNRLGFAAERSALGDAISVTRCPYAELVEQSPVICDIHTALVVRLLDQTGQPVTVSSMEVWARPGMCVARLNRPDLETGWTIHVSPDQKILSPDGSAS